VRGSAKAARALLIDDDQDARVILRRALERKGLEVVEAESGDQGLRELFSARPDIVLLDIGLPGLDGWGTLARIRQLTNVPVMMVSGESSELEKVRALQGGADDYVTKPFGIQELLARTEVLLRRAGPPNEQPPTYSDGLVEIDFRSAEVTVAKKRLTLTPLEFRLLAAFVTHPGEVLSARRLLELAWGDQSLARERVKIYIGYLRNKFRELGVDAPIETVRGFGYRYRALNHP
jgi:DNA-binding response OmpR family regulator